MNKKRPIILSIAGYDPSGGAGVLADIKTIENIGVYGMAVTTCITYQNDSEFEGVYWLSKKKIKQQLFPLFSAYKIDFVKIGLIENFELLEYIIKLLLDYNKNIQIILDPIFSASAGFLFHNGITKKQTKKILKLISWITPNWMEASCITGEADAIKGATWMADYCNVYLKGGHNTETPATDMIWVNKKLDILHPTAISNYGKHGTGCVLSSALTTYLAKGVPQHKSCEAAKAYTFNFINSNNSNLGYHITV